MGRGLNQVRARAVAIRNRSISGPERDGRSLAIAVRVLMRRFLRLGARFDEQIRVIGKANNNNDSQF
ncbi:hypothetical protein HMPREF3026_00185 [Lactobacillus sp. HMSC073D04]|nr:hypothetical protein HMPREF3026_00185 [Lactobacillus sp. HMSC073D04]